MERAELFLDGNAACALLGEDLQSGEAEFVEINEVRTELRKRHPDIYESEIERAAMFRAYRKLKDRLPNREFSYVLQSPEQRPKPE